MKRVRENMKNMFQKYKHGWILIYMLIYLPWFAYLEKTVTTRFHVVHMSVDDYIPFNAYFIVPYLLWFLYVAAAIVYFFYTNVSDYYRLCLFLFIGMTVFLIVSTVYPNGHYLRPSVFEDNSVFVSLVKWLYVADTSTNLFPSIHVYNSLAVHFAVMRSERLRKNRWVTFGSAVLMTSIVMSTVLLKQHSVFDVITAFAMAAVMYPLVYGRHQQRSERKAYEREYHQIT